eukprot:TRINITY_DN15733_c0_g1_i1.p1 TRINITY_DN15733_c0_g1~~TRINITY_DN15733_c0_g1_i1.p1  ORF type:complete len:601 (+),score=241.19 TRINITY_DN15733_c0_g1_i1:115-1917(+)
MRLRYWLLVSVVLALGRGHVEDDDEATVETEEAAGGEDIVSVETLDDIAYITPESHPDHYFEEHFDDAGVLGNKWIKSQAKKDGAEEAISKYDGEWNIEPLVKDALTGDQGLVLKSKAKHAAISSKLKKPFQFADRQIVIQYEIAFQNGQDCGGGYIKLLSEAKGMDLRQFNDKTPYTIMFGPDKCGSDSKLHFIFRHKNPLTGEYEEKHCKKVEGKSRSSLEEVFKDKRPHLLRLIIRPDNTFEVSVDQTVINHGSLHDSFTPPVNPPAEIDDPKDKMPADWDEREKIPDPEAVKPEDWDEDAPRQIIDESAEKPDGWLDDEPDMIPDPEATMPDDWDAEMDGDWEAPLIDNPACKEAAGCGSWAQPMIDNPDYKGKWYPELINNPNYKGKWKPRKIPNPNYFNDEHPFHMTSISGVGIELWSMSENIYFDNLLITDNLVHANKYAADTFDLKMSKIDASTGGMFRRILDYSNKNPWLYAVYVVLVGLPIVLIVTFCCFGGADKKGGGKDALNHPKKTDAPQADDVNTTTAAEEVNGQPPNQEEGEAGDGEGEEEGEEGEEEGEGEEEQQEEEEEEEEEQVEVRETRGSGARKRRPRKE